MRSDNSPQRLACPRCRANNFVGQAQCWQCKASLPPPEAMNTPTVAGWAQQAGAAPPIVPPITKSPGMNPQAVHPQWVNPQAMNAQPGNSQGNWQTPGAVNSVPDAVAAPRRGSKKPLILSGALLTAGVVVWFTFHRAAPAANAPGFQLPPGMSAAGTSGVLPNGIRLAEPGRDEIPLTGDPNEAAARRAIQRAIPRLGLPPGTGSDGTVHLRNGDTISREQYEAAQQKLKNNPLMEGPPTVPRL